MRKSILPASILILSLQAFSLAASPPFTLSPARVSDFKPVNYLYASVETSYGQVGQLIGTLTGDIASAMQAAGMTPTGGPLIVYEGAVMDPAARFTLKVGYPVADTAKAIAGYQLGNIGPSHCEMMIFIGSVNQLRTAYGRVFAKVASDGQEMSNIRAERYLYWESETSFNNVVMIEIGLKDPANSVNPNP